MATPVDTAVRFLREAAAYLRKIGYQSPHLKQALSENAEVYEGVAQLLVLDPVGSLGGEGNEESNAQLASRLLTEAAEFFRDVGDQNPEVRAQLYANAEHYDRCGVALAEGSSDTGGATQP